VTTQIDVRQLDHEVLEDPATIWVEICTLGDLLPERGAAALVAGQQVALFRTVDDRVYAVQQRDPFSGAMVMARGIVGTRGDAPTVASPMYKQVFHLRTGMCLDAVGKKPVDIHPGLRTWPVRVVGGAVLVSEAGGQPPGALIDGSGG
jgi:nitrite reductase (NADH) small subunit